MRRAEASLERTPLLVDVSCPGCGSAERGTVVRNGGFSFVGCAVCGSVYVSPRPTAIALERFRRESEAYRHKVGRGDVVTGIAERLGRLAGSAAVAVADWHPISPLVVSEILADGRFTDVIAFAPHPLAAGACHDAGARVVEDEVGLPTLGAVVVTEILDQVFSPEEELRRIRVVLPESGLLVLTSRSASGYDFSALGERAPDVCVPEHLNLFTEHGLRMLLARTGFELVECSTPGRLDAAARSLQVRP